MKKFLGGVPDLGGKAAGVGAGVLLRRCGGVAVRGDLADEVESAKRATGLAKKRNSFLDPATGWEYVIDEETGEVIPLRGKGNLYVLRCWLKAAPFGRQEP